LQARTAEALLIRGARAGDEAALRRLDAATWSPRVTPGPPPDPDRPFLDRFGADNVLVAAACEEVVGYLILGPWVALESAAHVAEVHGLAVTPERQGEGIAARLLAAAIERCRRECVRRLVLRVLSTNPGAIRLYERHGFEVEGVQREAFLLDGAYIDDLLMALDLSR
jgi:ribosomal protein S18 acetylase RimI-like enzyme